MENSSMQVSNKQIISIRPNPTTDNIQISGFEGSAIFVISDTFCRVLLKREIKSDEIINLKSISRGVYIAKIITNNGIERKKLEKK